MTDYKQNEEDEALVDAFLEYPREAQRSMLLDLLTARWSDDIVGDFSSLPERYEERQSASTHS